MFFATRRDSTTRRYYASDTVVDSTSVECTGTLQAANLRATFNYSVLREGVQKYVHLVYITFSLKFYTHVSSRLQVCRNRKLGFKREIEINVGKNRSPRYRFIAWYEHWVAIKYHLIFIYNKYMKSIWIFEIKKNSLLRAAMFGCWNDVSRSERFSLFLPPFNADWRSSEAGSKSSSSGLSFLARIYATCTYTRRIYERRPDWPIICSSGQATSSALTGQYCKSLFGVASCVYPACVRMRAPKSGVCDIQVRGRRGPTRKESGLFIGADAPMHHLRSLLHPRNARAYTHPCPEGPVTFRRIYNLNPDPITPRKDGPFRRTRARARLIARARLCVRGRTRAWAEFYSLG